MKKTIVLSGFPGVGKSFMFNNVADLTIIDSDSSQFSWIKDSEGNNTKERNPEFPNNYINHIKDNLGKVDIIMVSSHDVVREALKENNIDYLLFYPDRELKEEYIERYKSRGNDDSFIKMIDSNWDKFIDEIENENFPILVKLETGEYIKSVIDLYFCCMEEAVVEE